MVLKLKSSARTSNRYLLLKGNKVEIEKAILDYVGILGWARANPVWVYKTKGKVMAVNRKEIDNIKAAFAVCVDKIEVLNVSGTLKGLFNK
jgi:RNase P/RNase MRP subunit POP5